MRTQLRKFYLINFSFSNKKFIFFYIFTFMLLRNAFTLIFMSSLVTLHQDRYIYNSKNREREREREKERENLIITKEF